MHIEARIFRAVLTVVGFASGILFSTGALAQAMNFSFRFSGTMSCMQPVPVSNAPISGSGSGVLNQDGSLVGIPIGRMQGDFRFSFILPVREEMFRRVPGLAAEDEAQAVGE